MPVLDGFKAVKEIKKFLSEVPILMFSMHHSDYLIQEARTVGAQGFLNKSQAAATLLNAVDALLNQQSFFPNHIAGDQTSK